MTNSSNFYLSPNVNDKINHSSLKLLLTNARSLSPKIESLQNNFEAYGLDVALVTESWLKDGKTLDRDIIDLEYGTDLKIVYKNRPRKNATARAVGGGVSIIYSKSRCSLRERKVRGNKFELVVASGRVGSVARTVVFFCLYIEPKMKVAELKQLNELLCNEILLIKAKSDPIIVIGGDLNRKSIDEAIAMFPDIKRANHEPTRGNACLDVMFSNLVDISSSVIPPLETPLGVKSDHACVLSVAEVPRVRNFEWVNKMVRKHTSQAVNEFGRAMAQADWDRILPSHLPPDDMVKRYEEFTGGLVDRLFPLQKIRQRSSDPPWITNRIRRIFKQKCRVFRREGKSNLWRTLRDDMDRITERSKASFVDTVTSTGCTRQYFRAVKSLSTKTSTPNWSVLDLFPGQDPTKAAEETADFFTRITDEFVPLSPSRAAPAALREPISVQAVAKLLADAKKPNSSVQGDVLPRLTKKFHSLMATPAARIFNSVFRSACWPSQWKVETTVVIPKNTNPESLAECRNISCTSFLSKVLETVLLGDLRKEMTVDPQQYGGIKASSVDHLLIDLFDKILEPMERGNHSVVVGIDFEKAFNRLDHEECLRQLRDLGASPQSLALVRSFLTGRTMRIRLPSGQLSAPKKLCGGSPQGSILGCLLYCAATRQLGSGGTRVGPRAGGGQLPERTVAHNASSSSGEGDDGMGILTRAIGHSPTSSEDSFHTAKGSPRHDPESDLEPGTDQREDGDGVTTFKYVDDTTLVKPVHADTAIRHVSSCAPTEALPAPEVTGALVGIVDRAKEIGMRVNCKKTQLLCVALDNGYETNVEIKVGDDAIASQPQMLLLGYMLGATPGAHGQVAMLQRKFRAKFWGLIHLSQAGITGQKLFKLYTALVRPVLETNCVVYHHMLTAGQSDTLERMQKLAIRLCHGFGIPTGVHRANHNIATLRERRIKACQRFVRKTIDSNPRFAEKWFRPRDRIDTELRTRRPYIENKAKTDRYRSSPLVALQRIANDMMTA